MCDLRRERYRTGRLELQPRQAARTGIGQAIGILMERYTLDPDRAFSFLVRTSQTSNIKLRDVAAGIVADATARAG